MKWSSNCAHLKANFDFIGFVFCYHVTPWQQQDFAMLSDFGSLMQRQVATIGKQVLPAAFVIVHMRTRGSRTRRLEVSAFAKAYPRAPHEINVTGLIQKLIDVRAFVRDYSHTELLVFEHNASVALKDRLADSAAVVAIVLISLISH
jgi:hypothetical protein